MSQPIDRLSNNDYFVGITLKRCLNNLMYLNELPEEHSLLNRRCQTVIWRKFNLCLIHIWRGARFCRMERTKFIWTIITELVIYIESKTKSRLTRFGDYVLSTIIFMIYQRGRPELVHLSQQFSLLDTYRRSLKLGGQFETTYTMNLRKLFPLPPLEAERFLLMQLI